MKSNEKRKVIINKLTTPHQFLPFSFHHLLLSTRLLVPLFWSLFSCPFDHSFGCFWTWFEDWTTVKLFLIFWSSLWTSIYNHGQSLEEILLQGYSLESIHPCGHQCDHSLLLWPSTPIGTMDIDWNHGHRLESIPDWDSNHKSVNAKIFAWSNGNKWIWIKVWSIHGSWNMCVTSMTVPIVSLVQAGIHMTTILE